MNLFPPQLVHAFYEGQPVPQHITNQIEASLDPEDAQKLTTAIGKMQEKFSNLIMNECHQNSAVVFFLLLLNFKIYKLNKTGKCSKQ